MIYMMPKVNLGVREMGFMFVVHTFLLNNPSPRDINSTYLPCLTSVLSGDTSNSRNSSCSVVIENAMDPILSCKSLTGWSHICGWVGKYKLSHSRESTQQCQFSPLFQKIRNMKCVYGTHFQPFNIIRLKPVCNWNTIITI